ncbi:MAG: acetyl-CoA acetyltransferase [Acetobacteraceae bacterium]|jgi:acetyl-CoA C-acetyltransferase|nr:acetyl-CoA acetyltransferase [Acetobacteraceae bacterium]
MTACIVGWAHTPFGKLEDPDVESLIARVARAAVEDSGLSVGDVGALTVGLFNNGFSAQDFPSSLAFNAVPEWRFLPSVRVENACATGSAAIHAGLDMIAAGRAKVVVVIGAEKMTTTAPDRIGEALLAASYRAEDAGVEGGFAGVFARIAQAYFQKHGDQSDALAMIAAKNHAHGVNNPYAQIRKDLGFEFCRSVHEKNPYVAPPLRRTDCSLVSDGAAALVLAHEDIARTLPKAIRFRAAMHVNEFLPLSRRNPIVLEGAAKAWAHARAAAGITLDDLDFVETHDCFTIAELLEYEAMGLTPEGRGAVAAMEGWTRMGGRLPVNPSGGLKAKGHPIGATGVSMHALAAMQLTGTAGAMQVPGASLGAVFNMGGVAVANYVSVLEPLR